MAKVLCDTGVVRRYLGNYPEYVQKINEIQLENVVITPIIRIELHRWLSLYKGLTASQRMLYQEVIRTLPLLHLNEKISKLVVEITDADNSLDVPDILIGATAVYHKTPLFTANKKHFRRIQNIQLF